MIILIKWLKYEIYPIKFTFQTNGLTYIYKGERTLGSFIGFKAPLPIFKSI